MGSQSPEVPRRVQVTKGLFRVREWAPKYGVSIPI